ncbi:MAG: hypothetical protein BGO70_08035 [Bacteroidetes bacterium 43-93]|nr:PepSY-like domain-containing protein [Bacteroidota bacterium]OJW97718.1 MAG: hypothetical protein BGO70_08035 [Bacteroidetes bacterium 43-93]
MRTVLFVGCLLVSVNVFAQKLSADKVPSAAKAELNKIFPGVSPKWELEDKNYEANFKNDNRSISVLIDASGKWLEKETGIAVKELPENAKKYIDKNLKGGKIKEAALIEKANGTINYEAEVNKKDLIFDKQGNFIKSVAN